MNFKKILLEIAPFLGTMIGGPLGGAATKIASKILLGNENATDADLEEALGKASPDQLLQLKKVDAEYKAKMAELGLDEKKIAALDRKDARHREIALKDSMPSIIAIIILVGFFSALYLVIFYPININAKSLIQVMLGALVGSVSAVVTYYFGSSYGAHMKTVLTKEGKE